MITLMKNLVKESRAFGSIIRVWLLTLLVLTLCTCSGPRLMLGSQSLEKQTDYSLYSGKLAKQTQDAMACATLKTDGLALASWHQGKLLTLQQYLATQDSVYYQNQGLMLKKCLQIRSFQYPLITHSFLSPYKMVWIGLKQN